MRISRVLIASPGGDKVVHEVARHLDFTIKSFFKCDDTTSTLDVHFFDVDTEELFGTWTCFTS